MILLSLFLPRIIINKENIGRFLKLVDRPHNGLTVCTGSLGSIDNDIPAIIESYHDRIHFMHIRNVKRFENGDFIESSHRACDGSVDIVEVVKRCINMITKVMFDLIMDVIFGRREVGKTGLWSI
nr:mannonate dehydratase [Vibrio rumoiensis]